MKAGSKIRWLVKAALLLGLTLMVAPAQAQTQLPGIAITARAGFDRQYKAESWFPVHVEIRNSGPNFEGELHIRAGQGGARTTFSAPIELPTQSHKRISLNIFIPDGMSQLEVALVNERGRTAHTAPILPPISLGMYDLLYGVVANQPGQFDYLANINGPFHNASVAYINLADLPETAVGWSGLNLLILHGVDSGQLTANQQAAMQTWIELGGQLVFIGGGEWPDAAEWLSDLLPVQLTGRQSVDTLQALAAYSGAPLTEAGPFLIAGSALRTGELLIEQDGTPLLARRPVGRGAVYFMAYDPAAAALRQWPGHDYIWEEIANWTPVTPTWGVSPPNRQAASRAVESLPALALPSAFNIFLFLMIYTAIIGPLNYWFLNRIKRRELAWLTIPVIVLLFSLTAYVGGFRLKGNQPTLNQMSVAYGSVDGSQMRVQTIVGFYSPQRGRYTLTFPAQTMVQPLGQGGSMAAGHNVGSIHHDRQVAARDVWVDVSGLQAFLSQHERPTPPIHGQGRLQRGGANLELNVTVQNNSPFTLQNSHILYRDQLYAVGDLEAGASRTVRRTIAPTPPITSPSTAFVLDLYHSELLGPNYFNDRATHGKYQLLLSLQPPRGQTSPLAMNHDLTLIAWSDEALLDISVARRFEQVATTIYFLEIPVTGR